MRPYRRIVFLAVLWILAFSLACTLGGGKKADEAALPSVVIIAPPSGARATVGQEVEVQSLATDDRGIARVELWVDDVLVQQDTPPTGQPPSFSVVQRWTPPEPGEYILVVKAYNVDGQVSEPASIRLEVQAAGEAPSPATPTATPEVTSPAPVTPTATPAPLPTSPSPTPTPTLEPTDTPTPLPPTSTPKPTDTPTPLPPTSTPAGSPTPYPPLDFRYYLSEWHVAEDGWHWEGTVVIEIWGGDGNYTITHYGKVLEKPEIHVRAACGKPVVSDPIVVTSGDGQQVSKGLWIEGQQCYTPTPTP